MPSWAGRGGRPGSVLCPRQRPAPPPPPPATCSLHLSLSEHASPCLPIAGVSRLSQPVSRVSLQEARDAGPAVTVGHGPAGELTHRGPVPAHHPEPEGMWASDLPAPTPALLWRVAGPGQGRTETRTVPLGTLVPLGCVPSRVLLLGGAGGQCEPANGPALLACTRTGRAGTGGWVWGTLGHRRDSSVL